MNYKKQRWIPEGSKTLYETDECVVYSRVVEGRVMAIAYEGNSKNPSWHYRFKSLEELDQYASEWSLKTTKRRKEHKQRVIERRKNRNQPHTLKVGDILYSSWGYEQTNVDFYQVTKLKGKNTIEMRQIQKSFDHGQYSDYVTPIKDSFCTPRFEGDTWKTETLTKRVSGNNIVSLNSFSSAWKWDGKPKYQTPLGMGH